MYSVSRDPTCTYTICNWLGYILYYYIASCYNAVQYILLYYIVFVTLRLLYILLNYIILH